MPRNLETICLKCLEKEPSKRYASAKDLAEDIRRYLDGRPIVARPVGPAGRLWRWGRRNPKLSVMTAALVVAFGLGTPTLLGLWLHARSQQARAESARNEMVLAINMILLTDRGALNIEETRPYREQLLNKGSRIVEDSLRQLGDDPLVHGLRAEALMTQAKLIAEMGDRAQAYKVGQESVALWEELLQRDPASTQSRYGLAHLLYHLSLLPSDGEVARSLARRSNQVFKALLKEKVPAEQARAWLGEVATNLHNIGNSFFHDACDSGRSVDKDVLRRAINALEEGRKLCEEQVGSGGQDDNGVFQLALFERYLCLSRRVLARELHDSTSDAMLDEAIALGKKAVTHIETVSRSQPDHFEILLGALSHAVRGRDGLSRESAMGGRDSAL